MIPEDLKRRYRQGHVVPFVGAGASMSVHWKVDGVEHRGPSWSELVDQAAKDMGFASADLLRTRTVTDLPILEYYRLKKGLGPLNHWLASSMQPPDDALTNSPIHVALAKLEKCRLFYTTNFDDLLERGLRLLGRKVSVVAREGDNAAATHDGCEVVKFHGDLKHPETMVMSESHYQQRLSFSTAMDFRLLSDILNRVILFLGYSFTDPNVSYLFYRVQELLGEPPDKRTSHRAYIFVADPSDFEHRLFGSRNIGVIAYDGADRTSNVARLLEELRQ